MKALTDRHFLDVMAATHNFFDTLDQVISDGAERKLGQLHTSNERLDGRRIRVEGQDLIHFGSCSYLALERHPALTAGVVDAVQRYGTQFSSSRTFMSLGLYEELETLLGEMFNRPVIATATTTLGHQSSLPVIVGDDDAVILDQQVHASVQTAAQLLKARGVETHVVRHNRMDALERKLLQLKAKKRHIWYLADGVYSMYGDCAPMAKLVELLDRHEQFHCYIDDAHGVGWAGKFGRGYALSQMPLGPDGQPREQHERMVVAVSLNKSFAAAGGALVLPNEAMRQRIRNCGPTLIFSGPIQPPMLGAAVASAKLHLSEALPVMQAELADKVAFCQQTMDELGLPQIGVSGAPLFFVPAGLPRIVYNIVHRMKAEGFYCNTGVFPAVPMRNGGVRFTINRELSKTDIRSMLERLRHHYPLALAEEGQTEERLEKDFRFCGLDRTLQAPIERVEEPTANALKVRSFDSIAELTPDQQGRWDQRFADRGPMSVATLLELEQAFANPDAPREHLDFRYVEIEDEQGALVLAAHYVVGLVKEDMFAKVEVSEKVEAIRAGGDPDFLVSKAVVLGSPLSVGEHLFLDREHPRWAEALSELTGLLQTVKEECGATQVFLRDFPRGADKALERRMLELGYFEFGLPDMMVIDDLRWADRQDYLARLSSKYRYNVRKEAIAHEERFEVLVGDEDPSAPLDEAELRRCYELYCQVHAGGLQINVFRLPYAVFAAMARHADFDVLRFRLTDEPERGTVAVMFSYVGPTRYSALIVGFDKAIVRSHKVYKQALFRTVERAHALGSASLNLAFTAELEKKKLGARPKPTCAYVMLDDTFSASVLEAV